MDSHRHQPSSSPDADESESQYRPNRFRGPESTWRNLTAEDRQNAQALVDLRARDLAAHLYNAYALRVRARAIARRMADGDLERVEEEVFAPPKRWTAWPLPAADVPRPGELVRRAVDDAWTLRRQPDPRPSAELEESLMAVMMKTAKERFNAREWETKTAPGASTPRGKRKSSMSQAGTQEESAGDWESDEGEEQGTVAGMKPVALRPVVQADDEKSRVQLRPLTRNILTHFDTLLMGLHRARQGDLARDDDSSASEWQTDTASAISGSSSGQQQQKRRGSAAEKERSLSRGRKRTRRSSIRSESSGGPSRSRSTRVSSSRASSERTSSQAPSSQRSLSQGSSRSRGRSRSSDGRRSVSRVRQGLRDWSEVLGIASMTGFPAAAVMRASRRCADLFGEDMAFRTFHEGQVRQDLPDAGSGPGPWHYVESESEPEAELEPEPESVPQPEAIPLSSRASSRKPRSRATSLRGGSRSRATTASADDTPRPRGKGEHRKSDLVCPIKNCDRHYNGFSRTWNLNQHLKTMHPGYQPSVSARNSSAAKASRRKDNANEG
ncbi:hypothetical protein BO86DRAFT_388569 [Aspergillus japonicus CBS 114.51]|uniref:Rrn9 domain-containing protein n=1 Tax=Aspergillus japonicus CBS 114.51 TaxID=1448312 RepID=A0A8T8X3N7_ASPJA|nr:hypothetical protein BO86DRAFT_388569 [Aspergillus japonicus CBS 114.51]RAH82733.1 hypothetical protein BO86DRAFT_388569 [Aspergillus japonicus CBS 114.51]